jgi:flagellin-specific chaperone FliS
MQVATSAPRILSMLHSRCVTLIKQTLRNKAVGKKSLVDAQNILAQLESSLIIDDDLSKSLFYLYDYCYCRLESGNPDDLRRVLNVLEPLDEAFRVLAKNRSR